MLLRNFYMNIDGDSSGGGGMDPSWSAPQGPTAIPDVDDMFAGLESYFSDSDKPIIRPNNPNAKGVDKSGKTENREADPLMDDLEEPTPQNPQDMKRPDTLKKGDEDFKPIELDVNGMQVKIKSKEQLQQHLNRSVKATELFQEYKTIKEERGELQADLDYQDYLKTNSPKEFLELLTENMDFQEIANWMKERIKYEKLSDNDKQRFKEYQEGRKARERLQRLEQKEQEVEEKRAMQQAEEDYRAVINMRKTFVDSYKSVLDDAWIQAVVDSQIEKAKAIQETGRDVSLKQLQAMIKGIVEPVAQKLRKNVKPTERLRNAAAPGGVQSNPSSLKSRLANDPISAFEALEKMYS